MRKTETRDRKKTLLQLANLSALHYQLTCYIHLKPVFSICLITLVKLVILLLGMKCVFKHQDLQIFCFKSYLLKVNKYDYMYMRTQDTDGKITAFLWQGVPEYSAYVHIVTIYVFCETQ